MRFHKIIRKSLTLPLADKSAVGTINRPLQPFLDEFVKVHNQSGGGELILLAHRYFIPYGLRCHVRR